jgi:hypothetical protein
MFKVGQRVHNNKEGYFCKIDNIGDDNTTWVTHDDGVDALVLVKDLHETADDMFERLGYKKEIQIVKNKETGIKYKGKTYEIEFDFGFEGYFIDIIANDFDYDMFIKPQEHLAIHQKMIELGWV